MPKGVYIHKKGRIITWGDKISKSLTGRTFSEEHILNMSLSHIGEYRSKESNEKRSVTMKKNIKERGGHWCEGIKRSEETRRKQSMAGRKRITSIETREKIRQARLGVPRPELRGENNPMFTHPNAYKSQFGKAGFREDLGIFVRSSWEANMMRIFKYLGLIVQYEPQSFKLLDGRSYRPDFFIHNTGELIEVKGRWLKDAREKFLMFKKEYPGLSIEVIGPRKYKEYVNQFKNKIKMEV